MKNLSRIMSQSMYGAACQAARQTTGRISIRIATVLLSLLVVFAAGIFFGDPMGEASAASYAAPSAAAKLAPAASTLKGAAKYKLNIKQKLAKKGTKPRPGYKLGKFKGVTIHNTAEPAEGRGAIWLADMLRGKWKTESKSWHYGVDDTVITRSIPESEVSWHAGDGRKGTGNARTISIEICENADSDLYKATENAAALTAKILKSHGIKKAVSNKNIFQHNHWSKANKDCPRHLRAGDPYTWKGFIARVNAHLKANDV